jgi:hypothetical protein
VVVVVVGPVVVVVGAVVVVVGAVVVVVGAVVVVVDVLVEVDVVVDVLVVVVVVGAVDVDVDVDVTVVVGGTVLVVPVGGGTAGRTMTGVEVVTGAEVVVVDRVVEVLEAGAPAPLTGGPGLVVGVTGLGRAGTARTKDTRCVDDDVLLPATRAKVTARWPEARSVPMRTRAEKLPVVQLFGLCE